MAKKYNYTNLIHGQDFTLETGEDGTTGDMIGQVDMKVGDYITIASYKYQVVNIEYYSEPIDMWRAKVFLVK